MLISVQPQVHAELAKLGPPEHVCSISINPDKSWSLGDSLLCTLNEIQVPYDLKPTIDGLVEQGQQQRKERTTAPVQDGSNATDAPTFVYIDNLLGACVAAGRVDMIKKADVFIWRGVLRQIMMGHKSTLLVSLVNGKLFIVEKETAEQATSGWVSASRPFALGHSIKVVLTNRTHGDGGQWANVVSRDLGSMNVLLCGEVDCVRPGVDNSNLADRRVALKQAKLNEKKVKPRWDRHYLQQYLLGVPSIYVGYRDDNEQIVKTELLDVGQIDKDLGQAVRIDRGHRILAAIRQHVSLESRTEDEIWMADVTRDSVVLTRWPGHRSDKPSVGVVPVGFVELLKQV